MGRRNWEKRRKNKEQGKGNLELKMTKATARKYSIADFVF